MKKRFTLILGVCTLGLALIAGGTAAEKWYSLQENISIDSYNQSTNADKDSLYYDYIINTMESAIKDNDEILDCEIDVERLNGKLISADVKVITKNDGTNALETNIRDYVSKALEISSENITLSL